MDYFDVASIVLVNLKGKLIFQKRDNKPDIRNPDMITAWGGACEGAESPVQAARREMHEETNLEPSEEDFEFFGKYPRDYKIDGKQVVNHVYLLRAVKEESLKVYEGQGWALIDPEKDLENSLYTELTCEIIADFVSRAI